MTMEDFNTLEATELKKLETLKAIITLLDELEAETDDDAREWVMEKLSE